jgi:retron-type reverse transcriptase
VSDRIAQTAVKPLIEPKLDPMFHPDSYGYRAGTIGKTGNCRHQKAVLAV